MLKKNVGPKNLWLKKFFVKKNLIKKIFGPKVILFLVQNNFWSKIFLGRNKVLVQINVGPKNFFGENKFFGEKKFLVKKNFAQKIEINEKKFC